MLRRIVGLIVVGIILLIALSNYRGVAQKGDRLQSEPERPMTDAEVQAKWDALTGAISSGFKREFVGGAHPKQ
jgi:hypothetical protein